MWKWKNVPETRQSEAAGEFKPERQQRIALQLFLASLF